MRMQQGRRPAHVLSHDAHFATAAKKQQALDVMFDRRNSNSRQDRTGNRVIKLARKLLTVELS